MVISHVSLTPQILGHSTARSMMNSESRSIPPLTAGSAKTVSERQIWDNSITTIVYHNRYVTVCRDLLEERSQGRLISRQSRREISAENHDTTVGTSMCSVLAQFDGLPSTGSASSGDDRSLLQTSVVQSAPCGRDERNSLGLTEVNSLPHGSSDD